jgi:hypothetical protein
MESGAHDPAAADSQGRTAYQLAANKEVWFVCMCVCVVCVCFAYVFVVGCIWFCGLKCFGAMGLHCLRCVSMGAACVLACACACVCEQMWYDGWRGRVAAGRWCSFACACALGLATTPRPRRPRWLPGGQPARWAPGWADRRQQPRAYGRVAHHKLGNLRDRSNPTTHACTHTLVARFATRCAAPWRRRRTRGTGARPGCPAP